jgi:predicted AAA+ superfamily ATPase
MFHRAILSVLERRLTEFPVVALTGPRQSGKTTLMKHVAGFRPYVSLEDPDHRAYALEDPRGFLAQFPEGAALDEVQRCPALFSYLQGIVDTDGRAGLFLLSGSQQFGMMESITQSLAGRICLLHLWPFSLAELQAADAAPADVDTLLFKGLFPRLYSRKIGPAAWFSNYVATYLERDVRQFLNVQNLASFQRFVALCAGRVGQLLNIDTLASDAGISRPTANGWLSVLEASHVIVMVRPWFANIGKRFVKAPKLYFCDTGLAAWLLGAKTRDHVAGLPQRGALFENWVMMELLKAQANAGILPHLFFLRDKSGHEIDALVPTTPDTFAAIEVKAGETVAVDFFKGLDYWRKTLSGQTLHPWLVYGGATPQSRERGKVLPWNAISPLLETLLIGALPQTPPGGMIPPGL